VEDRLGKKVYKNIYSAIFDQDNNFQSSLVITRDVTELRKLETEKVQYQSKLE